MTPGEKIEAARKMKGLSRAKVGEALDIGWFQIYRYERGLVSVPGKRARQLADLLDINIDDIYSSTKGTDLESLNKDELRVVGLLRDGEFAKAINLISKLAIDAEAAAAEERSASG